NQVADRVATTPSQWDQVLDRDTLARAACAAAARLRFSEPVQIIDPTPSRSVTAWFSQSSTRGYPPAHEGKGFRGRRGLLADRHWTLVRTGVCSRVRVVKRNQGWCALRRLPRCRG